MKKKIMMVTSILIITVIIAIAVWGRSGNVNQLKSIDSSNIEEITISDPTKYYTITKHEDIQTLFKVLQTMNLSRNLPSGKDGFAFIINIKLKSGEKIVMSILSQHIAINNHYYYSDKNYCNSIRQIFNKLSQKYVNNPA